MDVLATLTANRNRIEERIAAACARAGRPRSSVTLVAVTKSVGAEIAALLPELGLADLGESRPQVLWTKAAAISAVVRWHMIGHLQRNKVERTLPLVHLIHSIDSWRLLESIDAEAQRLALTASVLLEVNVSREPNKSGLSPDELFRSIQRIRELRATQVGGLMTMAAIAPDPELCRPTFAELRQLRDRLKTEIGPPHSLEHLSMGMSDDFEVAIDEGATLIRVGSALFEGVS